jgi:hypothetical protein
MQDMAWFKFSPSEFMLETIGMDDEQCGKHIRKMIRSWITQDFTSFPALKAQFDRQVDVSQKRAKSGQKGGKSKHLLSNCQANRSNLSISLSSLVEPAMTTANTVPKKECRNKPFEPPTPKQVHDFCEERGYANISKKIFDYYDTAGWKDSNGKQVKNWKQKLIAVWFREENKDKQKSNTMPTGRLIPKRAMSGDF